MISVTFTLPVLFIVAVTAGAIFAIGFLTRLRIQRKLKSRVLELENEMIRNHSEILQLTHSLARLQNNNQSVNTPVISLGNTKEMGVKTAIK